MPRLTPSEFAAKWMGNQRTERAAAQEHFIDLCQMLDVPTPNEADPTGEWYAFEKGAEKVEGGDGFADVWKRNHFAWEYKGRKRNLGAAYGQLLQYREALDNPPLLVVSDLEHIQVHTNFTGTAKQVHEFSLEDLARDPQEPLRILKAVMSNPEALRPSVTRNELTLKAAQEFADLARALRDRGHDPHRVAHFLNKVLFCMFAEDAGLLPKGLMERLAEGTGKDPETFAEGLRTLFERMARSGGLFGVERIEWFNGGLFDGDEVLPLAREDIEVVRTVSRLDWSEIEPAIFGTLFERGLDPNSRASLGAHYTDRDSILRIVEPVVIAPLLREFEEAKGKIVALLGSGKKGAKARAERLLAVFLDRLAGVRVLDPACGSGNFLYLALQALKDLEREAMLWGSEALRIPLGFPRVGPEVLRGIELNDYAAELARVTIWIGEIQWMLAHGFAYRTNPILQPLDNIERRDAILDRSDPALPREPAWPEADFIVGNPPFLGGKLLRRNLGEDYVDALFTVYEGRVPRQADLVTYWFEKTRASIEAGRVKRAGLLATQGIRGGENRRVLERIQASGRIFHAWSDQPWILDGAAVHVSIVCFDDGAEATTVLDGRPVAAVHPDLTSGTDVTGAAPIPANAGLAFMGDSKGGPFELEESTARRMLEQPNPDGRRNRDVVVPWINGQDIGGRPRRRWIIDFGVDMAERDAALYEAPFAYVRDRVRPTRVGNRREAYARRWWLHVEARSGMRRALAGRARYIVTIRHSRHRLFTWVPRDTLPDSALIAFALDDDYALGVLHSAVHEAWARAQGSQVREEESGFRYTPTSCFETFPFPPLSGGLHGEAGNASAVRRRGRIAEASKRLVALREGWLNPVGPDERPMLSEEDLRTRTLTSLYNDRPAWLEQVHLDLDRAVLDGYAFPEEWAEGLQPVRDASGKVNPSLGVRQPQVEQDLLARLLQANQRPGLVNKPAEA